MLHVPTELRRTSTTMIGGLVLLTAAAVILAALAFEHIGGYAPCPLCLQQRYAYYGAIPALIAALALLRSGRTNAAAAIFLLVAAAFAVNAGLGVYQAGAEWKLWDLPTCDTPDTLPQFDITKLDVGKAPVCGVASWRLMGLSFAGWNAVVSVVLALGALAAAFKASGWRN
jgi:disulfide bond formation protein DsbB